jgi:hypothetical protein
VTHIADTLIVWWLSPPEDYPTVRVIEGKRAQHQASREITTWQLADRRYDEKMVLMGRGYSD